MPTSPERPPAPPRRGRSPSVAAFAAFLRAESAGGVVLVVAVVVALVWANSPVDGSYHDLTHGHGWTDAHAWVNEGAMTVFFLVVGLEIKRELVIGELRNVRRAALPIVAAVGGMVVPALLYVGVTSGTGTTHGWGIPMATDIAMVVGVMALLGRRVPASLKLFLLALAIVDDLGAIVVIAAFYSDDVVLGRLVLAVALVGLLLVLRVAKVVALWPYVAVSAAVWWALFEAGVHPTLAGVCLALVLPAARLERAERVLHPVASLLIVPAFALVNAGISFDVGMSRTSWGVVAGLVVGKPLGIVAASALAVRAGVAILPVGVRWWQLVGAAALAGVGFTVSIFVSELAFVGEGARAAQDAGAAKLGVLTASVLAAAVGAAVLCVAGTRGARTGSDDDQVV